MTVEREVWLLAGQSNMEGQGDLADGPEPHPSVRAFTLARRWEPAREPLHWLAESPDPVHHQGRYQTPDEAQLAKAGARKGVGPGLWFGRQRFVDTGRPVDLVCAAHGGTSLLQWLPQPGRDSGDTLYGSLLASVAASGARPTGVLWYQGCNDTNPADAARYTERMGTLVAALRRDLGQPELPWIVAQIGRTVGRLEDQASWNAVQEAQRTLPKSIPFLEVVATVDLELDDWIHLSARAQKTLAGRFAQAALWLVDGRPGCPGTPQPWRAVWDPSDPGGWSVRVELEQVGGGWSVEGLPRGFSLVGPRGDDLEAVCRTRVEGSTVRLRSTTDDLQGATVAYARGCDPAANLTDALGRALPAFRGLPIEGLPPVTPWVRSWVLHSLPGGLPLEGLSLPPPESLGWVPRTVRGWWYLVLTDLWPQGGVAGRARLRCSEAMDLEVRLGNDVPFRFFLDGVQRLAEGPGPRLTSNAIDFEFHRLTVHLEAGDHEAAFVAVPRDGGLGLDLRFSRTDRSGPLPLILEFE